MKYCTVLRTIDQRLCMKRCPKKLQIHCKGCNAMYVEGVKRSSRWSYIFLLITFLIFNQFLI